GKMPRPLAVIRWPLSVGRYPLAVVRSPLSVGRFLGERATGNGQRATGNGQLGYRPSTTTSNAPIHSLAPSRAGARRRPSALRRADLVVLGGDFARSQLGA